MLVFFECLKYSVLQTFLATSITDITRRQRFIMVRLMGLMGLVWLATTIEACTSRIAIDTLRTVDAQHERDMKANDVH